MKKASLSPGLEEVMRQLMKCKNFVPNPAFRKVPVKKSKKRCG